MVNFTLLEDIPTRRIITLFVGMSSKQVSWTIGKFKRIWTHCYVVDSKYQQDPWLGFPHCSTWSQQVSFPLTCWLRPVTSLPPILFGYLLGPLMSTYESHYTSHLTVANLVIMPLPRVSYPSSLHARRCCCPMCGHRSVETGEGCHNRVEVPRGFSGLIICSRCADFCMSFLRWGDILYDRTGGLASLQLRQ